MEVEFRLRQLPGEGALEWSLLAHHHLKNGRQRAGVKPQLSKRGTHEAIIQKPESMLHLEGPS